MSRKKELKDHSNIEQQEKQIREKIMERRDKTEKIYYPTGSDLLDLTVGGGKGFGYEGGHIINIVGDKSSGKSGLAIEMIAALKHRFSNVKYLYDDAESGNTFDTMSMYGLELYSDEKIKSSTVEDWYNNCRVFFESLKKNEIGVYILDSLDGLTSKEMNDRADKRHKAYKSGKEFDEGSYQMGKAKFLSQEFFPQIVPLIEKKNAFLVIISQTRDKIGSMFQTQAVAGGKALNFYCHTILWLREILKEKKKDIPIKIIIEAKTKKNKTARPFRKCRISFIFDYGIDNVGDNIDYLFDLRTDTGLLKKSSDRIQWNKNSKDITIKNIINFLKEENNRWYEQYEIDDPIRDLRGEEKINALIKWIEQEEDRKKEFDKIFGSTKTREELIEWIEQEEDRKKELTERVRERWEKIEQEVATKRIKKYN